MKILFLTRLFYPHVGGVEMHVLEVTKRLEKMGHAVTIVTEKLDGTQAQQSAASAGYVINAAVHNIPVMTDEKKKKFLIWRWIYKNRKLIEEADVIHAHDVFFWYLPFRFLYPGKKVYTTFHGYETIYPPRKNAIRMRKLSASLSRGNIAVGDFIKKWYGTAPTYTTYGGVGEYQMSNVQYPMSNKKLDILFIGRLEEDTGVLEYVKLLELLKNNQVEFSLTVLGDGTLRHELEKYGRVEGFVKNVVHYIGKANVIFASSYLSILQGLAEKKFVVALYDNPLKKDYLLMSPFADFIIAEPSAEKAYEKLKFFILNPNRLKKMIHEGSSWADIQTWDKVTELYLKLWKKIIF
jgi:glycosyltransferase involved in cell wall biosynthesis